jgi:hypothetical protein
LAQNPEFTHKAAHKSAHNRIAGLILNVTLDERQEHERLGPEAKSVVIKEVKVLAQPPGALIDYALADASRKRFAVSATPLSIAARGLSTAD